MSIHDDNLLLIYCCTLAALLGAAFGSFLNCAAWRAVHGGSVLRGRSRCPDCGHVLGAADLVPVLSWLLLRGKCRWCGRPVPARYLLTELGFALVSVLCLLRFDLTAECLRNWVFLCCLYCLSLADLDGQIVPDGCLVIAALAWLAALPFLWSGWADAGLRLLAGAVYGGGLLVLSLAMDRLLGKETLGGGDVKLFAVIGLYLGLAGGLFALLLACVLGLIFAFLTHRGPGAKLPFAPCISLAAAAMLLYGGPLVGWYLSLF